MRRRRSGSSCSTTTRSSVAGSRTCSRPRATSRWSASPVWRRRRSGASPRCGRTSPSWTARLPDGSGIDVCREIRSRDPEIAALILTSYDDDEALFAAIMAGAAGYVLKQVRGNDLVDAVRRVAAGQSTARPRGDGAGARAGPQGPPQDKALRQLTDQEQRILELIGEGLTNRQIAERMFLAEKTVKNYVVLAARQAGPDQPHAGRDVRDQAHEVTRQR